LYNQHQHQSVTEQSNIWGPSYPKCATRSTKYVQFCPLVTLCFVAKR